MLDFGTSVWALAMWGFKPHLLVTWPLFKAQNNTLQMCYKMSNWTQRNRCKGAGLKTWNRCHSSFVLLVHIESLQEEQSLRLTGPLKSKLDLCLFKRLTKISHQFPEKLLLKRSVNFTRRGSLCEPGLLAGVSCSSSVRKRRIFLPKYLWR